MAASPFQSESVITGKIKTGSGTLHSSASSGVARGPKKVVLICGRGAAKTQVKVAKAARNSKVRMFVKLGCVKRLYDRISVAL